MTWIFVGFLFVLKWKLSLSLCGRYIFFPLSKTLNTYKQIMHMMKKKFFFLVLKKKKSNLTLFSTEEQYDKIILAIFLYDTYGILW